MANKRPGFTSINPQSAGQSERERLANEIGGGERSFEWKVVQMNKRGTGNCFT